MYILPQKNDVNTNQIELMWKHIRRILGYTYQTFKTTCAFIYAKESAYNKFNKNPSFEATLLCLI